MRRETAKPSKTVYVSLSLEELAALEAFSFRERWAYIAWKRIANFKTGVAGRFGKQKLTYVELAKRLNPPPGVQGRGQGAVDDTQARDILLAFERAGLVADIGKRGDNGGLTFTMPMAPIGGKNAAQTTQPTTQPSPVAGQVPEIFPECDAPEIDEIPMVERTYRRSESSLSVSFNRNKNINTEADLGTAEAAPCRATGAAPRPGKSDATPDAAASVQPLSIAEIEAMLLDDFTVTEVNTPAAREHYRAWERARITRIDLELALSLAQPSAEDDLIRPADLQAHLCLDQSGEDRLAA